MVTDWPSYKFTKIHGYLCLYLTITHDYYKFSIIDKQKSDGNTNIANKNIELSRFSRLIAHPIYSIPPDYHMLIVSIYVGREECPWDKRTF